MTYCDIKDSQSELKKDLKIIITGSPITKLFSKSNTLEWCHSTATNEYLGSTLENQRKYLTSSVADWHGADFKCCA